MKKEEVLQQLEPLRGVNVRTIEHQPRTRVVVQPEQVILRPGAGGRLIPLNEEGVKSLAQFIGMSQTMGKEISPELFGQVSNHILARRGHFSVTLIDGAIASFGRPAPQWKQVNPERLVSNIERAIPNPEYLNVAITAGYTATIELVGDKRVPVVKGDLIRAGALVNFSPIGTIAPSVQSFVERLACTNGMAENTILREYSGGGGDGDDEWQWFRKSLRDAYNAVTPIVDRYREMIKNRIPDKERVLILENMLHKGGIKGELADAIRARAIQEPPRNEYQMLNLITFASTHLARDRAHVQRLRSVAADFSSEERHSGYCPICHHAN